MKSKLLPNFIHNSWNEFLSNEIMEEIMTIESKINSVNFTPDSEKILRFLENDLNSLKVIILGQDPYPEKGRATGRSFEVGDLVSWQDKFKQISLKNIIRLIYKSYNNIEIYSNIKPFSQIKEDIKNNVFNILPPNILFKSWEEQGVLLLNTSLTCEVGKPGSHKKLWSKFSTQLLTYISTQKELHWFLWGSQAISNEILIKNGFISKSRHPMMCLEKFDDDFLKSDCFNKTKNIINWLG
ncbi:MAG: uracil-DNA glycosylase [Clostridiales bacterium]